MSDFAANLGKCHVCDRRQKECTGACLCDEDRVDVIEHARQNLCPLGLYGDKGTLKVLPEGVACPTMSRPGDAVRIILTKMGYSDSYNCDCLAFQTQMNEWGWIGCIRRKKQITDWFVAKAAGVGIQVDSESINDLLLAAWQHE